MSDFIMNNKKKQSSSDQNNNSKTADAIVTSNNRNKTGMIIHEPTEVDVLCGRGGMSNHHPGNEWYRRLIKSNRPLYRACPKHTKLLVAKAIVQAVEQQTGRFLERSKKNGYWYIVSYKRAVDKTSQGLRERDRVGDNKDNSNDNDDNDDSGKNSSSTTTTTCSDEYSDSGSSSNNTKKKSKINTTKTKKKQQKRNDSNDNDDDDCHNVSSEDDNDDDEEEEEVYEGEIPEGFRVSSSIRAPDLVELASVAISNEKNRYNRTKHKINSNSTGTNNNNNKSNNKMEKITAATTKTNIVTTKSILSNKVQQQPKLKNSSVARKENHLQEDSKDLKRVAERLCDINDNNVNGTQIDYNNSKNNYQKRMKMSVHDYRVDNLTNGNRRINNNMDTHERHQQQRHQQQYRNNDLDNVTVTDRDNIFKYNRINNITNSMQQYHLPQLQANESTASTLMPLPPSMEIQESSMLRLLLHTKLLSSASSTTETTTTTTGPAGTGVGSLSGWNNITNVNGDGINYFNAKNDNENFSNMFNDSAVNFMRRTATRGQSCFNNTYSTEQQQRQRQQFVDNNDYPFNNMNHNPVSYEQMHNSQNRLLDLLLQEKLRREQLRNSQQQQQQGRIQLLEEPVLDVDQENCQKQPDDTSSSNKASINNILDETTAAPPSTTLARLKSQVSDWLRDSFWPVPAPGLDDAQISSLVQNKQQQKLPEMPTQHDDDTTTGCSKRCMDDDDNSERQKRMKFNEKHGDNVKASSNANANAFIAPFSRQDVLQRVLASIPPPHPKHMGSRGVNTENNEIKHKPIATMAYGKEKDITEDLSSTPLLYPHSLAEPMSSAASEKKLNHNIVMQHARGRRSRKSLIDDDDDDDVTTAKNDKNNTQQDVKQNQQSSIQNDSHARANYEMLYQLQKEVERQQERKRSEETNGRSSPCLPTFDDRKISLTLPSLPEFAPTESTYSLFNGLLDPFDGTVRHTRSDDDDDDDDNRHFTDRVTNGAMSDSDKHRVNNMIEGAKSLKLLSRGVSKNAESIEKDSDNSVKGVTAGIPAQSQTAEEYDVTPLGEVERAVSASLLQLATATPRIILSSLTSFFDQGGINILSTSLNNMKKDSSTVIESSPQCSAATSSDVVIGESTGTETVLDECVNQSTVERVETSKHFSVVRTDTTSTNKVRCEKLPLQTACAATIRRVLDDYDETTVERQMRVPVVTTAVPTSQ